MQEKIIEALRRNALDEALNDARAWATREPENPQALRWLTAALLQRGNTTAAAEAVARAIELAPEDSSLPVLQANVLLASGQVDEARTVLGQATQLDPNQFAAYLMQAQLAFARGDLDEAERQNRLAGRAMPEHPRLALIDTLVALQRGKAADALKFISSALARAPEDPQLRHAAGFAYLANGHLAFAEQAFRGSIETTPNAAAPRYLLADLIERQGRLDEAADVLQPLLDDPVTATTALLRQIGRLRVQSGQVEVGMGLLLRALAAAPDDWATLRLLVPLWLHHGQQAQARASLDAALATHGHADNVWQARFDIEQDPQAQQDVLQRWQQALPQSARPLEIQMFLQQHAQDVEAASATAERLLQVQPSNAHARLQLLRVLSESQGPQGAIAQLQTWLAQTQEPAERGFLLGMLGLNLDQIGDLPAAVQAWSELQSLQAPRLAPLPPTSAPRDEWPALATRADNPPRIAFLWGLPGSGVERLATVMAATGEPFRSDRLSAQPPQDGFQAFELVEGLPSGRVNAAEVVSRWRATLPSRNLKAGEVLDWLPWWDNALLFALRPYLREAMLVMAIRDPRDTLLEWLAFGSVLPFGFPGVQEAAEWLAKVMAQAADLHQQQLFPNRVIFTDQIGNDPAAAAEQVARAFQSQVVTPDSVGAPRFPTGYWRKYADVLAGPFATLAPVVARWGYPVN